MLNLISSSRYKINRIKIKITVTDLLIKYHIPDNAIINLVFIGKKKMKSIAAKYKQENTALPVLSFSYLKNKGMIENENTFAEIFICYPQAVLLAAERDKKVDAVLDQLITHGIENVLK